MKDIKAIFILAGHGLKNGNKDPGATSNGLIERDLTKIIANNLFEKLKNIKDFKTFLYGINNLSLDNKVNEVNKKCKDNGYDYKNSLLIEIHVNAGGGTGIEAYSYNDSSLGKELNKILLDETTKTTLLKNRGAKFERESQYNTLKIIHDTKPLASLFECGFIDTEKDRKVLQENIDSFYNGIYNGLKEYVGFDDIIDFEEMYNNEKNRVDQLENANKILKNKLVIIDNVIHKKD